MENRFSSFKFSKCLPLSFILGLSIFAQQVAHSASFEPRLIESLTALQFEQGLSSERKITALIEDYPNSQTAHLMMADLLAARAGIIDPSSLRAHYSKPATLHQLDGLRDEIRLRWNQINSSSPASRGLIPSSIIQLSAEQKSIVYVDTELARLYVYKNEGGKLSLSINNYTTIGEKGSHKRLEGDERTPVGVYHITRFIKDRDLPPLYGTGAFPINYPNEIDRRHQRTGYGIWLHGTHPESFNRVPLASDGCVAMSNPDFDLIKPLIEAKNQTTVIISDKTDWIAPKDLDVTRNVFNALLQTWVSDWESRDAEQYLRHYDKNKFSSKDHN
ncbi:MAG: L,D-transpeptidase family protein, partial [Arenicellales bacterium]